MKWDEVTMYLYLYIKGANLDLGRISSKHRYNYFAK